MGDGSGGARRQRKPARSSPLEGDNDRSTVNELRAIAKLAGRKRRGENAKTPDGAAFGEKTFRLSYYTRLAPGLSSKKVFTFSTYNGGEAS